MEEEGSTEVGLSAGQQQALLALLRALDEEGYDFVPPTPATHARVVARPNKSAGRDLRDGFGWNLAIDSSLLPRAILDALIEDDLLERLGQDRVRSRVRVARVLGQLFAHSGYPTDSQNAVFLGPDSYRFVRFVRAELAGVAGAVRLVDIGAGAGVGGILAAPLLAGAHITLVDVNPRALGFAEVNAAHAGVPVELVRGNGLDEVEGPVDLIIANPPYMLDERDRLYRHGGGMHGAQLSLDWALAAARRLEIGGRMLLYTGTAIVAGHDALREGLALELPRLGCTFRYEQIDPDVFGEELEKPDYAEVERVAVVTAVMERKE